MSCVQCGALLRNGEIVRAIPNGGSKPSIQMHVHPHGADLFDNPVSNECLNNHGGISHVHERCLSRYLPAVGYYARFVVDSNRATFRADPQWCQTVGHNWYDSEYDLGDREIPVTFCRHCGIKGS